MCIKQALCRLQNQEGLHLQQDSLAACLGGNITPPSSWATWPSALTHSLGVVAARGIEVAPLAGEVLMVLEVGHSLVEAPTFKAVADGNEFFVLLLDFSDNGMPVSFELGTSLVVALVALHFGRGGEVQRMDCCSQCEEWSPC